MGGFAARRYAVRERRPSVPRGALESVDRFQCALSDSAAWPLSYHVGVKMGLFAMGVGVDRRHELSELGLAAETDGFDSIWIGEHAVWFRSYRSRWPYGEIGDRSAASSLEPFGALCFLAGITSTIRLATGIAIVPQRNPVYTAQSVTTLDVLSEGRFDFGIGIGWSHEEFDALNAPWSNRAERCEEYIGVMRALWTQDPCEYSGRFYTLPTCHSHPKPTQEPHPPLILSGHGPKALERAARLGDGWYGWWPSPDEAADCVRELKRHRGSLTDFKIVVTPPWDVRLERPVIDRYEAAGVDLIVPMFHRRPGQQIDECLDRYRSALSLTGG